SLEKQIKSLALDRHVFLTGFRSDALPLIKSFDLFAMSSVTEGLGSAVLEAMACRRAILATRAGGLPEGVADGGTRLLVPPQDDDAMARAILTLLRDPSRRAAMGDAGYARVATEFSVEKMVNDTVAVYQRRT